MAGGGIFQVDEQIERVKGGGTLSENEIKELCEKVSKLCVSQSFSSYLLFSLDSGEAFSFPLLHFGCMYDIYHVAKVRHRKTIDND